jgi:hypothetical protein
MRPFVVSSIARDVVITGSAAWLFGALFRVSNRAIKNIASNTTIPMIPNIRCLSGADDSIGC